MAKELEVDIQQMAAQMINKEKNAFTDATSFITESVAFNMRNLIRRNRKNYWGVFDEPYDSVTGAKKVFIPLIQSMVEASVKNIDLDAKDINFRARKSSSINLTSLVRAITKKKLDEIFFGEYLDELERVISIDGTCVWKTTWEQENGKRELCLRQVDLLNIYIDPVARNMQESTVIERAVLSEEEFKEMSEWINKEDASPRSNVHPNDENLDITAGNGETTEKFYEIYERWGYAPKSIITGKKKDEDEMVKMQIVVSNAGSSWTFHYAQEYKEWNPYEECWYTRVPGRWYGLGQAEKLMSLQEWVNTVVNIRKNRSQISQLGLFKIKDDSGITPQMISRFAANGAVKVRNMDDIQQFQMQDSSPSSYKDEEVINQWAQRVTQTFDIASGETLPSSTTATTASIQSNAAQSSFTLVKEGIGLFLQRWINRHILPEILKGIKQGEIIQLTGELDNIEKLDDIISDKMIYDEIKRLNDEGKLVSIEEAQAEKLRIMESLKKMGAERFYKLMDKLNPAEYDSIVYVTNEEMDKSVLANNLIQILQLAPDKRDVILPDLYDLFGLNTARLEQKQQLPAPQGNQQGLPEGSPESIQSLVQQANTFPSQQAPQIG